nr:hypothetical protein [Solanum melongena]WMB96812.1 hypothetical protein [Solanum melongena]WMB97035.1 hypothetical protein [Solanum aethiopicum]
MAYPFSDYAILGDDVLITDDKVAMNYRKLLDKLGVSISDSKSIVSKTGCVEFAKKFRVKNTMGLCQLCIKYHVNMSVLGAGYRVRSRTQSKRWERIKAVHRKLVYQRKQLPLYFLDFWLGRGMPLNPY